MQKINEIHSILQADTVQDYMIIIVKVPVQFFKNICYPIFHSKSSIDGNIFHLYH